ncbi:MAG: tRNA (5-methylaminomethyl-2-thiouridine)(34)-methyltransferase MnmD [Crocinitomicaceae bacterium]|nr:tRNA (5-methylaminomethyl-2-thiouridine)(34)-methyltransferase MnmD [Crocinitomicaceae bacterium]
MKREIITTRDGSNSIFIPELNESYHSSHGAIQEAKHVFIKNGITRLNKNEITVFEMGFGTGLNAFLTSIFANSNEVLVHYIGLEAYPVTTELASKLNYVQELGEGRQDQFDRLHSSPWGRVEEISTYFKLNKVQEKVQNFQFERDSIDIVFYDAFGPRVQSELWSVEVLENVFNGLKNGAILCTYCAQGQFKRNLKTVGFNVDALPGPPGKREMTLATKP